MTMNNELRLIFERVHASTNPGKDYRHDCLTYVDNEVQGDFWLFCEAWNAARASRESEVVEQEYKRIGFTTEMFESEMNTQRVAHISPIETGIHKVPVFVLQNSEATWDSYEKIRDSVEVDSALANFYENATADNAAEVVRAVLSNTRPATQSDSRESEAVAEVTVDGICFLKSHPSGGRWPKGTKLYAHPATQSDEVKQLREDAERWLPISSAPKDGTEILLISAGIGDIGLCYWRDDDVMCGWTWGLENPFHGAVGWLPLPKKPSDLASLVDAARKGESA